MPYHLMVTGEEIRIGLAVQVMKSSMRLRGAVRWVIQGLFAVDNLFGVAGYHKFFVGGYNHNGDFRFRSGNHCFGAAGFCIDVFVKGYTHEAERSAYIGTQTGLVFPHARL